MVHYHLDKISLYFFKFSNPQSYYALTIILLYFHIHQNNIFLQVLLLIYHIVNMLNTSI